MLLCKSLQGKKTYSMVSKRAMGNPTMDLMQRKILLVVETDARWRTDQAFVRIGPKHLGSKEKQLESLEPIQPFVQIGLAQIGSQFCADRFGALD